MTRKMTMRLRCGKQEVWRWSSGVECVEMMEMPTVICNDNVELIDLLTQLWKYVTEN